MRFTSQYDPMPSNNQFLAWLICEPCRDIKDLLYQITISYYTLGWSLAMVRPAITEALIELDLCQREQQGSFCLGGWGTRGRHAPTRGDPRLCSMDVEGNCSECAKCVSGTITPYNIPEMWSFLGKPIAG